LVARAMARRGTPSSASRTAKSVTGSASDIGVVTSPCRGDWSGVYALPALLNWAVLSRAVLNLAKLRLASQP
jgi:hypothetical protein